MDIRLCSKNDHKIKEAQDILFDSDVKIIPFKKEIHEIQTLDVKLVRDKALKAFQEIGKPLIVEHTGLYIDFLNDFPGGLTQIFWDSLEADKFCELLGSNPPKYLTAKTVIGYCNGRTIEFFEGEARGTISEIPKGNRDFQWDCVFIPEGESQTYSEMGNKKNEISMRKLAYENFKQFIKSNGIIK